MLKKLKESLISLGISVSALLFGTPAVIVLSCLSIIYFTVSAIVCAIKTICAFIVAKTGINMIVRLKLRIYYKEVKDMELEQLQYNLIHKTNWHYGFKTSDMFKDIIKIYLLTSWYHYNPNNNNNNSDTPEPTFNKGSKYETNETED